MPPVSRLLQEYSNALADHPIFSQIKIGLVGAGGAKAVILGMPGYAHCLRAATMLVTDGTLTRWCRLGYGHTKY